MTPYLSIVVTSRNDNHGENLLRRMQIFLNCLLDQIKKHHLTSEIIIVEWNPPHGAPSLAKVLDLSCCTQNCKIRIIKVSPEIHQEFAHSDSLPIFQMIAKNAGIRRAAGEFILATNVDLFFSESLIDFLAVQSLKPGFIYRINRYDVPDSILSNKSVSDQLKFSDENILRINNRDGIFEGIQMRFISRGKIGLFMALSHQLLQVIFSWNKQNDSLSGNVSTRGYNFKNKISIINKGINYLKEMIFPAFPRLHTMASGDFTLMSRKDWFDLHGYPELPIYSLHLDTILCYMAYYAGIKEEVLNDHQRIYHMEHKNGWTPRTELNQSLHNHFHQEGVPILSHDDFRSWIKEMKEGNRPFIFNNENWGLAETDLPERTFETINS